jgi:UDP-N-acetylglucosamine 2-epimerase (non-hydrolysing)
MRKKILTVLGTRPEAIKLSPILLEFEKCWEDFESFLLVTGQHRKMLDQVLSFFGLHPNDDLNLMKHNQRLSNVLSDVIHGVDDAIERLKPDLVMVQGDTTSTLGAALAAFYNKVPVGHVEAGLRTGNLLAPYPEEGNRQLVSRITEFHFAPTELNKRTLLAEGTGG